MIMAMTVFVVGRTQIVSVDVAETQDPFEDAAESELNEGKENESNQFCGFRITTVYSQKVCKPSRRESVATA